jgi:Bacterial aa3 type cytochrome c oxidase subunit IV
MAKKPAAAATAAPAPIPVHVEELPPEMDYAAHEATWRGVTKLVKLTILSLAILVVGLYCIIQGGAPALGAVLIIASFLVPVIIVFVTGSRPSAT